MIRNKVLSLIILSLLLVLAACAPAAIEPSVTSANEPVAVSHGNEIGGYVELVDALSVAGAMVVPAGEIEQPFFSVGGRVITVDSGDVQVFEYADTNLAAAEASLISPDDTSVGASMITWIATPHFYTMGKIIVLYVGDDSGVTNKLEAVLGDPIAVGQAPFQSDDVIDPFECDAANNIDACTAEELEALGSVSPDEGEVDGSEFWVEMEDPQYGVGFAVPCYWEVNFPQEYPPGGNGISYPIRNYTEDYVFSFPRGQGVFENGGIKIDMNFMDGSSWGAAAGTSLIDFVGGLFINDSESSLVESEELVINGQTALLVTTESAFGEGQFYLFSVTDELYLLFGPNREASNSPDVLGILSSIALTTDVSVAIPDLFPDNPPKGLLAPCMGITELPSDPNAPPEGCQAVSFASLEELTSGLEENFHKANTGGLIFDYMNESIAVAIWRSEGQEYGRNDFGTLLANSYYNYQTINVAEGKLSQLTFTTDRSRFPPLMGIPAEIMFGPYVHIAEVIYSEGWGQDGLGAALLFIAENDCGRFYWHGLVYSPEHFDK